MITDDDMGREVKVVLTNSERVRGVVTWIGPTSAMIRTSGGQMPVEFNRISTVTRIGDHSSDRDTR